MRYPFIKEHEGQFSISALCRVMKVARSGYYAWRKRAPSKREQANEQLTQQIKTTFEDSGQTYGSPRIYEEIKEKKIPCSQKRIARLMRAVGIKATLPKRFVVTTDSNHALPVAQNVLDRQFDTHWPNTRWTGDITYIWTSEGWLYLAVVLDLFSRRIVGWAMGDSLDRSLVLSALSMALNNRQPGAGLLCHSDRTQRVPGQYASEDYQKALEKAGATCSMSRRGNCWDNAPTESFFSTLKRECVYRHRFATRQEARGTIFEWIEVWYNRKRRHSALGYLSPEAFERQNSAAFPCQHPGPEAFEGPHPALPPAHALAA